VEAALDYPEYALFVDEVGINTNKKEGAITISHDE
jgi:hypothetical protein